MRFTFNTKQIEALKLFHDDEHTNILLYGGARSSKSFVIVSEMVATALQFPDSRQLIARFRYSHVKSSIWEDTLPKILKQYPSEVYTLNNSDLSVSFFNGSKIVLDGLDSNERIDKILGQEYCRIYLNECSQISYKAAQVARTRLAQKVPGLINKVFYDLNPSEYSHWTYSLFFKHEEPNGTPIINANQYIVLQINPSDNLSNLPDGFLESLETLPETERIRFMEGRYQKLPNGIYYRFNPDKHVIPKSSIPQCDSYYVGCDLITYAAVLIGQNGNKFYIIDEVGGEGLTASELNKLIREQWASYKYRAFIDHNLGEAGTREFDNSSLADKSPGSVEAGINLINQLIENDNFYISDKCLKTLGELVNYRRTDAGQIIKKDDHFLDAVRYAIYSSRSTFEFVIIGGDGMMKSPIADIMKRQFYLNQRRLHRF